jgi:hypothetical protein
MKCPILKCVFSRFDFIWWVRGTMMVPLTHEIKAKRMIHQSHSHKMAAHACKDVQVDLLYLILFACLPLLTFRMDRACVFFERILTKFKKFAFLVKSGGNHIAESFLQLPPHAHARMKPSVASSISPVKAGFLGSTSKTPLSQIYPKSGKENSLFPKKPG